nr:hypothetical protein [Anaerolineae bacterium]
IIVSGRSPATGNVVIAVTDSALNNEQVLFDATAAGLWMQDAVFGGGAVLAFGKPGGPDGALSLYRVENGVATALSGPIGGAYPSRVEWSATRGEAVVTVQGGQYRVGANGSVAFVVPGTEGATIPGTTTAMEGVPAGVLPGSRYTAGQQVQYIGADNRNLRALPSTSLGAVVDAVRPGEFVGIIAGPYINQGFEWWYLSNARDVRGWMAAGGPGEWLLNP